MTMAVSETKNALFKRIEHMSGEDVIKVLAFVDSMEEREPSEETLEAVRDTLEGKNLSKPYEDIDEMMKDLLQDARA